MTATNSVCRPFGCAAGSTRGCGQRPGAGEWRLVSEASHELRTPLTALRAEVDLALAGNRDASELRAALRSAAEEIRRVCRLADDILMLAQADHGKLPLRRRPLEPRVLLEAAAARARAAARTRGRQILVCDMAPGRWLLGDPDRAAQALDNLISNALQYGGGTITLTAHAEGSLLGLHVADQGSGFARDLAQRAFQRFTRGKRARDPGSGLGLSLVAAIARAHRGVATVANLPEGGADACIALPRCFPAALRAQRPRWAADDATIDNDQPASPRTPAPPRPARPASQPIGSGKTVASCHRPGRSPRCRPAQRRVVVRRTGPR
jgi:signal transduction histidine kinase